MKKLLLILLTICCSVQDVQLKQHKENPNPDKGKYHRRTAGKHCKPCLPDSEGRSVFHRPFSAGWLGAERANTQTGCSAGTGFTVL